MTEPTPESTSEQPTTIPDVVDVEVLRGGEADETTPPDLLVEVPHGADRRHHYDTLRKQLVGDLPDELEIFFHLNTDVGGWAVGRATAERLIEQEPRLSVLLLRSSIPRTFIDCNRPAGFAGGDLTEGGLTAGIPAYVQDDRDRELLLDLHARYVEVAEQAYRLVTERGGLALVPHTYGPRSLGITGVGDDIVEQLRWACAPERHDTWPLRAEVDLLTRDEEGVLLAPEGLEERLTADFSTAGFETKSNDTYCLIEGTMGHEWSVRWPGRVLTLEIRRDLLVEEWRPFEEMLPVPAKVDRVVDVLAPALHELLA